MAAHSVLPRLVLERRSGIVRRPVGSCHRRVAGDDVEVVDHGGAPQLEP
jgi:hypothetical protein